MAGRSRLRSLVIVCVALGGACTSAAGHSDDAARVAAASVVSVPATPAPTTPTTSTSTTVPPPPPRPVSEQQVPTAAFASVAGVTLVHPSVRVERVGFHQSNHDGARPLDVAPTAASPLVLESRERDTVGNTAADVVIDPDLEVRAPVTGVVKRSGGYTLYCKYRDDYAVIAPDAQPSWEVKILHIDGVQVHRGQRVVGGVTVVAPRATRLPFESQVEETATKPAWPHVHVEVVDPSIKDRPTPGGGCS